LGHAGRFRRHRCFSGSARLEFHYRRGNTRRWRLFGADLGVINASSQYRSHFDCNAARTGRRGEGVLPRHPRLVEKAKPPQLIARGGCWFVSGGLQVHLGVEKDFVPARKAHPAFIVDDLAGMVAEAKQAGYKITADEPIEGCERRNIDDPFGNRIELIEPHAR
jgi:Glyoxalase/Bleomycin resistance protein/Dioxygenase superfamily